MPYVISRFNPATPYGGLKQFDCGHAVINKFVKDSLRKQVKQGLSVAYVLLEESDLDVPTRFVGFYTISSHAIALSAIANLSLGALPKTIPCLRLAMLGIDVRDAKQGLGRQLLNHAFDLVHTTASAVGCYGLYLDADANALAFYEKLGFKMLGENQAPKPSPMFITRSGMM